MNTLKYVRLTNGDSIVASVDIDPNGNYIVNRPLQIYLDRRRDSEGYVINELVVAAWLPAACSDTKEITLDRIHVFFVIPIIDKVSEYINNYAESIYENKPMETSKSSVIDEALGQLMNTSNKKMN